jgi:glycerophosphoryl diester phosphodiesterase
MYAASLLASPLVRTIKRDFHALQIPVSRSILRFDSPRFTKTVRKLGLQLHYWTVNEPAEMLRLSEFATGIVTDRVDLAPNSLRS